MKVELLDFACRRQDLLLGALVAIPCSSAGETSEAIAPLSLVDSSFLQDDWSTR